MWQRIWIGLPDAGDRQAPSREAGWRYLCQCMGQLRYLPAASWMGAAVVEKLAATWCSKPFSQM